MSSLTRSRIPASLFKMAVFTVVTVVLTGVLATLIGNISFRDSRTYAALFTDVTGLHVGDRVRLSGVEVGSISDLEIVPDGERRLARVEFTVLSSVPLYRSARLQLRYENLVGQRYLAITERPGAGAPMAEGGIFPVERTEPALSLTVLFNGFQPLFRALSPDQVNKLSYQVIQVLQGEGATLARLMRDTAQLTSTLAEKDAVIGRVLTNLTAMLDTLDERDTKLTSLIENFRDLMRGLAKDRDTIDTSLPTLASLLESSSGMLADVRAPLKADIGHLKVLAGQLADTRDVLDQKLKTLPGKIQMITRAGTYGSWFNFYACGLQFEVTLLGQTLPLSSPAVSANERDTVCGGGNR